MSRPVLILIAVVVVLLGLTVLMSTRDGTRATTRVEKVVPLANLQ